MQSEIPDNIKTWILEALRYLQTTTPCTTITKLANALNLPWHVTRHVVSHMVKSEIIIAVTINGHMLWCLDEYAAHSAISELRRELWRVLCGAHRRKTVTASTATKLIAADPQARQIYSKYVNLDRHSPHALKFVAAILEDLLGPPVEKTKRKTVFYIKSETCKTPIKLDHVDVKKYKQPHRLVTFKVTRAMYHDILVASTQLGISVSDLVRMAIARLLTQYRDISFK
jgi:hypothetical protein